jgi:integrase
VLKAARLDEGMHFHDLRHLVTTDAFGAAVLGHSTLQMVAARYARHAPVNGSDLVRGILDGPGPSEQAKEER